jgi:chromate reductase, NAD(P)H dehydrogenase (quinone)
MRIVTLSGSLRAASTNTALLEACQLLAPPGVELRPFRGVGELPHFNPDVETTALPAVVAAFRDEITRADGLLISSPEYARGIPGALKNSLDWLVGHPPFAGKPVGLLNASPRSVHATVQLLEVLTTMRAGAAGAGGACVRDRATHPNLASWGMRSVLPSSAGKGARSVTPPRERGSFASFDATAAAKSARHLLCAIEKLHRRETERLANPSP